MSNTNDEIWGPLRYTHEHLARSVINQVRWNSDTEIKGCRGLQIMPFIFRIDIPEGFARSRSAELLHLLPAFTLTRAFSTVYIEHCTCGEVRLTTARNL